MTRTSPARVEIGMVIYLHIPGTITLNFTYDPDGIALGVNLNGTDYYYLYNAQGDVIALYDSTGTIVTEYKYDSWGKLLSTTGSGASTIGTLNPLRYRGYFYDTDLSLYLLETRYYDPETGRFINADGVVDNRGVQTTNLYTYCANNPVNNTDEDGQLLHPAIVCGIVGAVIGGSKAYLKNRGKTGCGKAVLKGALIGGGLGLAVGLLGAKAGIVGRALIGGAFSMGKSYYSRNKGTIKAKATTKKSSTPVNRTSRNKTSTKKVTVNPAKARTVSYNYSKPERAVQAVRNLAPSAGDYAAGVLGMAGSLIASSMETSLAVFEGAKGVESIAGSSVQLIFETQNQILQEGFDIIANLFPGEVK